MKENVTKTKIVKRLSFWSTACLFAFLSIVSMESAKAQYTAIPDQYFEQALYDQGIDDTVGDLQVLTSAINGLTNLDVSNLGILDLTGIQEFTSLLTLNCKQNSLLSLDVSGLSNLQSLDCSFNNMTSLIFNGLSALTYLDCSYNGLSSIDVTGLTNLITLNSECNQLSSVVASGMNNLARLNCSCNYNLTSINLTALPALVNLDLSYCQLTSLDVTDLSALTYLACGNNRLTNLQVHGLSSLSIFDCHRNELQNLDLSGLTSLLELGCGYNRLQYLDASGSPALGRLYCNDNMLSSLNLTPFNALTNLLCLYNQISCITVTDPIAAAANVWWVKDATATYSVNCNAPSAPTARDQVFCAGATVANLVATGSNLQWYAASAGGSALSNTTVLTTGTYYVSQTVNGSESPRTSVSVTIITTPALPSQSYFVSSGIPLSSVPGYGSSYSVFASATAVTALPSSTVLTSGTYYATQTQNGCESTRSVITVVVYSLTAVSSPNCGSRLNDVSAPITATPVANATSYLFEVTGNGTTQTFYSNTNSFNLTQLQGTIAYNTTYSIRVAAGFNGQYGAFGTACNLTTPALANTTQVISSMCGTILAALTASIYCGQIVGAQAYRFEFTAGGVSRSLDSTTNSVQMSNVTGVAYGTTYSVRVAAQVAGTWQAFGAPCTITTPAASSQIRTNQCGTILASKWTILYCSAVAGATAYRFEWKIGNSALTYASSTPSMQLGNYTGWALNTTYGVRVAVLLGGTWQAYGSACKVKTPTSFFRQDAADETALTIKAIPNPFETDYVLMAQGGNQTPVQVVVYDMLGKQVEQFSVEANELENRSLGSNYNSGIYNVMISQGNDQQVVRIVKK
ncbi:MAG: hypothetical protein CFE24_08600 [Flavobacterium sp. BFFFF2]|nr:MAG: hypothetical protein CFE24_08600 [Flavobacterium sp. BFFFF2]